MPSNNYNVCHYITQRVIAFLLDRLAIALSVLLDILVNQLVCGLTGDFLKVGTADPEHRCVIVAADGIIDASLEKAIAVYGRIQSFQARFFESSTKIKSPHAELRVLKSFGAIPI